MAGTGSVVNSSLGPMVVTCPACPPPPTGALCYDSRTGWGASASGRTTWRFKTRLNQNVNKYSSGPEGSPVQVRERELRSPGA